MPTPIETLDLSRFQHVVVLTGAGVSVASGLPTYRGTEGLWNDEELVALSSVESLEREPVKVISFFGSLRKAILDAQPNAAHRALALAEARRPAGSTWTVITQNVDRLHQRAGSRNVIELHGCLLRSRCTRCDAPAFEDHAIPDPNALARCAVCGSLLRPDVTLFGEALPVDADHFSRRALRDCDLFLAVGTSGTVWPAAGFVRSARYAGALCVYVNLAPLESTVSDFGHVVQGAAEVVLPMLLGVDS